MILQNFHCHTTYCDGENSPEEMVLWAIEQGMEALGFSGHSFVPFDQGYCMDPEKQALYRSEIARLKEKYKDDIKLFCGIEQDILSPLPIEPYDFMIGSVHYVTISCTQVAVDYQPERMQEFVDRYFSGDWLCLCELYYESVSEVAEKTNCDIVGHFDLITKYNEGGRLFSCSTPRYIKAWQNAADRLLEYNIPFEINTGAMSRGYRREPYPAMDIMRYIHEKGGKFMLSSDAHKKEDLLYCFDTVEAVMARENIPLHCFTELKSL